MSASSNSISSSTSQQPSADMVQITVKVSGDKSKSSLVDECANSLTNNALLLGIQLNVSPEHTVANILEFLSASTTLPAEAQLVLAGKQLDPATTVSELKLEETSCLNIFSPSTRNSLEPESQRQSTVSSTKATPTSSGTSTPKKKSNKPRCSKEGCKTAAQPIVGDCGFCQKRFCGKHRMLESHNCAGLEDARQADKDRNAAKLEGERTVMLRGL